jgi:hypothetical protein
MLLSGIIFIYYVTLNIRVLNFVFLVLLCAQWIRTREHG